ncbi:hypothetical protein [Rhizobium sp. Root651]|uniref:hypothetical protein n=1 Tax=Rhizobium sp. Root651 TaxID=1736577 RepID=UPI000714F80F|nr:hypothetical protein [Rhizobium sp. Root651]KRA66674.1 hypothetical protein ASD85_24435 [Rhizobium sp. Root651]
MKNKAAKKQANQQYANDMAAAQQQREWQLEDRDEERAYNRAELDETREYSRQVLSHLVEDAEKAGFNPLTALRAGSGSSYNAAAGLAPLSATPITRQAPVRQAVGGSVAADAIGSVGDFISNFDPFADSKREQEYRLVESQIAALNASALSGVARGAGSFAQSDFERRPSGRGASLSRSSLGQPAAWKPGDVNVTNPFQTEPVNKDWSDAATWEERYGEPGSWVGGVVVGGADLLDFGRRKTGWNQPVPKDSKLRKAARWVDDLFGLRPNKKTGRLSTSRNGGGGGW